MKKKKEKTCSYWIDAKRIWSTKNSSDGWVQLEDRVPPKCLFPTMLGENRHLFFLSREGITGIQKLIPRETTISYLVFSITEEGLALESEKGS